MKFKKIICLLIFILTINCNYCYANPETDLYSDANITHTDSTLTVYLKSENVNFIIDNEDKAFANHEYVLKNYSTNEIFLNIYLPFYEYPYEVELFVNDAIMNYDRVNLMKKLNTDANPPPSLSAIKFNAKFKASEEINIKIKYCRIFFSQLYEPISGYINEKNNYKKTPPRNSYFYKCLYLSRTGASWKLPIEKATFTFKINKNLLNKDKTFYDAAETDYISDYIYTSPEYEGYTNFYLTKITSENDNYVILSKTFENWIPKIDVGVSWLVPRIQLTGIVYAYIRDYNYSLILILVITILITYSIKKIFSSKSK